MFYYSFIILYLFESHYELSIKSVIDNRGIGVSLYCLLFLHSRFRVSMDIAKNHLAHFHVDCLDKSLLLVNTL